jgi:cyanate permease
MRSRIGAVALVMAANALIQFDWLTFAPMTTAVATHYRVTPDQVGLFALCFAVLFLPLGIPSGWFIDRFGVRTCMWVSAALLALGGAVRAGDGFSFALAGQTILAIAQPLVMSVVSPLALTRHPPREHLTVISLCMMSTFAGLALAFFVIPSAFASLGIPATLRVLAAIHVVLAIAFLGMPPDPGRSTLLQVAKGTALSLLRNRAFLISLGLITLGNAYFNGLATWLEQILRSAGVDAVRAGYAGAAIIVGGVAGSIVVPVLAQRLGGLRAIAPGALLAVLVLSPIVTQSASRVSLYGGFALLGLVLLGIVPLFIDFVSELAGAANAGFALATFWTAANAGAAAAIALLPLFARGDDWRPAIWALEAIVAVEFGIALLLRSAQVPTPV